MDRHQPASAGDSHSRRNYRRFFHVRRGSVFALAISLLLAVFFVLLVWNVRGQSLEIRAGDVARETILASRAVQDTVSTQLARQEARNAVTEKYAQDSAVKDAVLANIDQCFAVLDGIRMEAKADRASIAVTSTATIKPTVTPVPSPTQYASALPGQNGATSGTFAPWTPTPRPTPTPEPVSLEGYHESFLRRAEERMPNFFGSGDVIALLVMEDADFANLRDQVLSQAASSLDNGIKENLLEAEITKISDNLTRPLLYLSSDAQRIGTEIVNEYLRPNLFSDEEATQKARAEAEASVPNVIVREGQSVIRQGEIVTEAQYAMLVSLGLVEGDDEFPWYTYASLAVFLGLMAFITGMYLVMFEKESILRQYHLLLLLVILLLTGVTSWLTQQLTPYLTPVILTAMLVACLFNRRMAMVAQVMLSLYVALLAYDSGAAVMMPVAVSGVFAGTLAINLLNKRSDRSAFIWVGFVAGAVQALIYAAFGVLSGASWSEIGQLSGCGLANGLLACMLALGTLPLWEALFQLMTPMKMMELCNPNQPLLKRLLLEAPGTYHHSVVVANLAEAAAEEIGVSPMLVRVGAYYHDIGKMNRPSFFKENQQGPNPHDAISPELSARILLAHVSDGVEMARKARLPQEIIDMISAHHGDTMQTYFWYKAKQTAVNPDSVRDSDYRYPGPRPSTREAAIIMMADSVEAAVRSQKHPTEESIENMVRSVIKGKFNDNQLDLCDLTLRDIERIIQVFIHVLHSVYHERIEYPTMDPIKGEKNDTAAGQSQGV